MPRPPASVARAARRGLDLRAEQAPSNRAGTPVGIRRASQLANLQNVPEATLRRMVSFFARHDTGDERAARQRDPSSKARQAWLLWGGDPGRAWAQRVLRRMGRRSPPE